jgi:hypothetical protein
VFIVYGRDAAYRRKLLYRDTVRSYAWQSSGADPMGTSERSVMALIADMAGIVLRIEASSRIDDRKHACVCTCIQ